MEEDAHEGEDMDGPKMLRDSQPEDDADEDGDIQYDVAAVDDVYDSSDDDDGNEDYDDADETEPQQPRALPVPSSVPAANGGPPTSAAAYLAAVRAEAMRFPNVLEAPPRGSPSSRSERASGAPQPPPPPLRASDVAQPAPHATPKRAWAAALLRLVRRVHVGLARRAEALRAEDAACTFREREHAAPAAAADSAAWHRDCWDTASAQRPTVESIARLDHLRVVAILDYFDSWIADAGNGCHALRGPRPYWLFALLCAMEEPFTSDVCATLRSLLRQLCKARSELLPEDKRIMSLNVFIVLLAYHFGQDTTQQLGDDDYLDPLPDAAMFDT